MAGILQSSRLGSASVNAGTNLEFRVITSVIIGGASLSGGEGSVYGTALGTLLVAFITNALTLFGVSVYWNQAVTGSTLLLAVLLDALMQRRKLMYGKGNPVDALDVFGVHAKDGEYPVDGKTLGKEMPLGTGRVDFPELIKKLKILGYDGALTIEREISGDKQLKDIVQAKKILQALL